MPNRSARLRGASVAPRCPMPGRAVLRHTPCLAFHHLHEGVTASWTRHFPGRARHHASAVASGKTAAAGPVGEALHDCGSPALPRARLSECCRPAIHGGCVRGEARWCLGALPPPTGGFAVTCPRVCLVKLEDGPLCLHGAGVRLRPAIGGKVVVAFEAVDSTLVLPKFRLDV